MKHHTREGPYDAQGWHEAFNAKGNHPLGYLGCGAPLSVSLWGKGNRRSRIFVSGPTCGRLCKDCGRYKGRQRRDCFTIYAANRDTHLDFDGNYYSNNNPIARAELESDEQPVPVPHPAPTRYACPDADPDTSTPHVHRLDATAVLSRQRDHH